MPATSLSRAHRRRRRAAALVGLGVAVAVVAALALVVAGAGGKPEPDEAAGRFVAAWSRGDDAAAARVTDHPRAATSDLAANRRGLDGATVTARVVGVDEQEDAATARIAITWEVPGIGGFAYRSAARLRRGEDDAWTIAWTPKVIHPQLSRTRRLGTTREAASRGNILDRDGAAIVRARTVYRVGLQRDKVRDVDASVAALGAVVDVNTRALARAVRGAGPKQFVEAITAPRGRLPAGGGCARRRARRPRRADRGSAGREPRLRRRAARRRRARTAEQLERLGDTRGPGDQVGQSGLQARYESASAAPRRGRS